jgi:Kef-type K+ transport system membrane component KefB
MLLIIALVYLAYQLGLDALLGAFAAGVVVRLFAKGEDSEVVRRKLEAIGFGFLVPIFFIVSRIHFNVDALTSSGAALLRLPLFLLLFLVVRGTPALLLYRRDISAAMRVPLALFSATGLPMIVVITSVGVAEGRMRPENAAALVGAGMLSVVIFPALGLLRLRSVKTDAVELSPAAQPRNP